MKRIVLLILAITLTASLLTACAQPAPSDTTATPTIAPTESTPATEPSAEPGVVAWDAPVVRVKDPADMAWMHDTTPVTLKMFINMMDDSGWQWGNDRVTQYITERTGVTLDYSFATDAEGNRLTLMLASGDPLPDFIAYVGGTSVHMDEMIKGDYIYPLNELINEYAPEFMDMLDPAEKIFMAKDDGNFYGLPSQFATTDYFSSPFFSMNGEMAARADILEQLGNPTLNTVDDLFATLEDFDAIKADYPEVKYPFYTTLYDIWTGQPFYSVFGGITGLGYSSVGLDYNIENNTLQYQYYTEEGIAYLKFLNQLHRKGYLTAEMFTAEDVMDVYSSGSMFINFSNNVWQVDAVDIQGMQETLPGIAYTRLRPIVAQEGQQFQWSVPLPSCAASNAVVISRDSSNPERAIKFLEYIRTEEGQLTLNFGIYNEDFEIRTDDNGVNYPARIGAAAENSSIDSLKTMGIYNHTKTWFTLLNYYDVASTYEKRFLPEIAEQVAIKDAWMACMNESVANNIANAIALEGGSDIATLRSACEDVIKNMIPKIVLAKNDAEFETQYQALLSSLEQVGVQQLYELYLPLISDAIKTLTDIGYTFK